MSYGTMTTEELRVIARRKNSVGCATKEAIQAQYVLYVRANPYARTDASFCSSEGWRRSLQRLSDEA